MEGVIEEVSGLKEFGALTHLIEGGQRRVRAGSVFGAASALIASALSVKGKIPVLFLCANTERQRDVFDDFCSFGMNPLLFPQLLEGAERRVNAALERDRLRILESLRSDAPTITVATFRSVEQSVPSPELLSGRFLKIKVADNLSPQELVRRLEKASYEVSDFVGVPGEYSRRGGIVDVYPFDSPAPCRIEFFGDEVESIRLFDEGTQQTKRIVEEVEILLRADGEAKEGTVFDFLPRDGLVVVEGVLPSGKKEVNEASLVSLLLSFKSIFFSATPTEAEEDSVNFPFTPARVLGADMGAVMGYLEECSKDCKKLFLFFPTEGDKERFLEISEEKTRERIVLQNGAISGGFIAPQVFAVLSYSQMFGKSRLPPQPEAKAPSFSLEIEMAPGDFCVHTDYGICRFRGVHRGGEVGMKEESLVFEFSEGALLYLPVLEVEKVHRYIGAGRASPPLSRLGDTTWVRRKERVKESLGRLAEELLLVQAKRMVNRRASYPRDSVSQREFEAAFPYSETEDQLKAVDKVKRAMESTRPMDFLVAGDVGYGKTEIAMRAAFKAVEFGKQVAVLVPTTLLSEQHFRTFSERFADYPIIVEVLSRFRKPAEQRAVIDALKEGRIDIIIGTHRLLSRDVEFHDLGLVIIDEEQRFGVEQKEHFKRLRA
ncbi:MAG: DEAD/DEAH box helicase, partial [Planctomycetota bacterium]|nr:DEAD/DEAH box helicase [Planctomycetota bacterium]